MVTRLTSSRPDSAYSELEASSGGTSLDGTGVSSDMDDNEHSARHVTEDDSAGELSFGPVTEDDSGPGEHSNVSSFGQ